MSAGRQVRPVGRVLVALLGVYRRWVSPLMAPHCRFHPSCSAYAIEAITVHGALRGTGLALRRLVKCQPFFTDGYDPVPLRAEGAHR
ncbi:MAG TPA: membrane protein insertion efficiency factor YidD [Mycobacteriales bacterium]|nr:membrane protein insertion efficiency factor YidD [Mycobacteriales bacterium]